MFFQIQMLLAKTENFVINIWTFSFYMAKANSIINFLNATGLDTIETWALSQLPVVFSKLVKNLSHIYIHIYFFYACVCIVNRLIFCNSFQ